MDLRYVLVVSGLHWSLTSIAAPERLDKVRPVSQRVDTWSLGCVFSLAATWIVLGYGGIKQFESLRKDAVKAARLSAIEKNAKSENPLPEAQLRIPPVDDDSFHDGKEVLAEVTQWHKVLRASLRKTDAITSQVLDVVDNMMLIGKEIVRERAKNVCIALEKITKSFGCVSMPNDTKDIQEKLVELDQTLPYVTDVTKSTTPAQPTSDDRKARKEKLLAVQPPMK